MLNLPYLTDENFLSIVDSYPNKEHYAKIQVLDWNENLVSEIQGKVISGSVSLNGDSATRRVCSFSMVAEASSNELTNIDNLISINKKFHFYTGYKNVFGAWEEFDIIWFPMGTYVFSSANITHDVSSSTINVTAKDKMCLLDGSAGGTIHSTVTFHEEYTYEDNGDITATYPIIYKIIQELVHHWGGEQLGKIIIEDVDDQIKLVMQWKGGLPLYYNPTTCVYTINEDDIKSDPSAWKVFYDGSNVGYTMTDFTYPGELIVSPGTTVTQVLDMIKNVLGNYEYFYDLDGNFRFREIKNYLNTSYLPINKIDNETYEINFSEQKSVYSFRGAGLVTNYSNTPNFDNIKNDFVVWGEKVTAAGSKVPIRYHLAIDSKPQPRTIEVEGQSKILDWRAELYLRGKEAQELGTYAGYYWPELAVEWPKLYNMSNGEYLSEVLNKPSNINYYLDFIDDGSQLSKFSVNNINRRSKIIVDSSVNCVYEDEIPDIVIINMDAEDAGTQVSEMQEKGQIYSQCSNAIYSKLVAGGSQRSAFAVVRELVYQYTTYNETITLSSLPVYYLEPNNRIEVEDSETNIYGDFIIKSMTIPLNYDGVMSLNAVRATERI